MKIIESDHLSPAQRREVQRLWNEEFPDTLRKETLDDLKNYFSKLGDHRHYVLTKDGVRLAGWLMTFNRDGDRWFALLVDRKMQGQGFGTRLLNRAKQKENRLNGWVTEEPDYKKSDGTSYLSPLDFYRKNDFRVINDHFENEKMKAIRVLWTKDH